MNPILVVSLIALILSIFNTLVTKLVTNEDELEKARKRMSENQKIAKEIGPNSPKYKKIQDEIIKDSLYVTKESYKPLLYTTIVFIVVLFWLSNMYSYSPISVGSNIFVKVGNNANVVSKCLGINTTSPIAGYYKVGSNNCSLSINGEVISIPMGYKKDINKKVNGVDVLIKPPKLIFLNLPFSIPYVGNKIGFFGYYIIISLIFGTIFNLAFKKVRLRRSP